QFSGGASSDASHLALTAEAELLPEGTKPAAAKGFPNAYEWDNGTWRLAGILPNGEVPAEGSRVPRPYYRPTVSADGSRAVFVSPGTNPTEGERQLYLRRDHTSTAWVSEPEGSTPVPV